MARPAHAHGVRVTDTSLQADIDDLRGQVAALTGLVGQLYRALDDTYV